MPRKPSARAKAAGRQDPTNRHNHGFIRWGAVVNPRPDMKYVLAYAGNELGVAKYEALGFTPVVNDGQPNGVKISGGQTSHPGQPVQYRGSILMSIPLEQWEAMERHGTDEGTVGLEGHERTMRAILREDGDASDLFRGQKRLYGHDVGADTLSAMEARARRRDNRPQSFNTSSDLTPHKVTEQFQELTHG